MCVRHDEVTHHESIERAEGTKLDQIVIAQNIYSFYIDLTACTTSSGVELVSVPIFDDSCRLEYCCELSFHSSMILDSYQSME